VVVGRTGAVLGGGVGVAAEDEVTSGLESERRGARETRDAVHGVGDGAPDKCAARRRPAEDAAINADRIIVDDLERGRCPRGRGAHREYAAPVHELGGHRRRRRR
jgi:hypothetical protein